MEVVNPSMTVSRLDLGGSGLCGGWMNILSTPLGFLEYWGIYRAKRWSGGTRGGHYPPGRAWAFWRNLVGCPLLGTPPRCNQGPSSSFWSIKNHRKLAWHLDSV